MTDGNKAPLPNFRPADGTDESEEEMHETLDALFGSSNSADNLDDSEDDEDLNDDEDRDEDEEDTEEDSDENDEEGEKDEEDDEDDDNEDDEGDDEESDDEDLEDEDEEEDQDKDKKKDKEKDKKDKKDEESLEQKLLRLKLEAQEKELEELRNKGKQEDKDEDKKESEDKKKAKELDAPAYELKINDEMIQLLASAEEPEQFKKGMEAIVNGVATVVHREVMKHVDRLVQDRLVSNVPEIIEHRSSIEKSQAAIRDDFFKHYPGYNDEKFAPVIVAAAEAIDKQYKPKSWSPEIREAIALRIRELTGFDGKADPSTSTGNRRRQRDNKKRQKRGAGRKKMLKSGARKSAPKKREGPDIGDEFEEMFGSRVGKKR